MQGPFMQKVNDLFGRLKGSTLIAVVAVWLILMIIALLCVFGVIRIPGINNNPQPVATAGAETEPEVLETVTPTMPAVVELPTPTATPDLDPATGMPQLPWGDFGYGIAAHGISLSEYTMNQIKNQLGLTWVKQQVRWDHFSPAAGEMDWSGYDIMIDAANAQGLKVMLSVVGAPKWSRSFFDSNPEASPPDDYALYADFLGQLVDRYKGKIHAIEVWNEQNLDREWDTVDGVDAKAYVDLLRLSYQAIKGRDPSIIVISGALSPTGATMTDTANAARFTVVDDFVYFQQMIDAGFLAYADCVGAHHNGINMPPDIAFDEGYNDPTATFRGPFDSPHHSWSFKSTLWGYHDMIKAAQYNTPLCVTEFGWATSEGFEDRPVGFEFADDNTLAEQAEWDVQAFQLMREWGFVHLAFLWNLDYSYKGGLGATDPNAPYSITDLAGGPRDPTYGAIGAMEKTP